MTSDEERGRRLAEARRRAKATYDSAVRSERAAIQLHVEAAARLRSAAEHDREQAEAGTGDPERWREVAEAAERRADAAEERAEHARQRLRDEGEDPEG